MRAFQFQNHLVRGVIGLLLVGGIGCGDVSYGESASITKIKELALGGDTLAQVMLGEIYFDSLGVSKDLQKAHYWFTKAAERGDFPNSSRTDYYYSATVPGVDKQKSQPFTAWQKRAAEEGDPTVQYTMGETYWRGKEIPKNYAQALYWCKRAAEQGHRNAQARVGLIYYEGQGVPQSYPAAFEWFKKAAKQGSKIAQLALATMYSEGQGIPRDYEQAHYWADKAVIKELNVEEPDYEDFIWYDIERVKTDGKLAQSALGIAYFYEGKNAYQKEDRKLALSYFIKSAQRGYLPAFVEAGSLYEFTQPNYQQAAFWYREGAEKGSAEAQFRLGHLFEQGAGMPQNYPEAARWYQKSAEQGNGVAQEALGRVNFFLGDDEKAFYWFKKRAESDLKEEESLEAPLALSFFYYAGQIVPKDNDKALYWRKRAEKVWENADRAYPSRLRDELNVYMWR